jgi:hypothetical protein
MSTSSSEGIRANRSAPRAKGKVSKTHVTSGPTSETPFAYYDPATHSWRTSEDTSLSDSEPYSQTWPPSGIARNGKSYLRPRLARHTAATGSSSWPTPRSSAAMGEDLVAVRDRLASGKPYKSKLEEAVALWPTPRATMWQARNHTVYERSSRQNLENVIAARDPLTIGQKVNPTWVEWLMGFPLGWTDLEHSGTESSHKSPNGSDVG